MKLVIKNKLNENITPQMLDSSSFRGPIVQSLRHMLSTPDVIQTGLNILDSEGRPTIRGYYLFRDGDNFSVYHLSDPSKKFPIQVSDYI